MKDVVIIDGVSIDPAALKGFIRQMRLLSKQHNDLLEYREDMRRLIFSTMSKTDSPIYTALRLPAEKEFESYLNYVRGRSADAALSLFDSLDSRLTPPLHTPSRSHKSGARRHTRHKRG